jgi:hypothetical protein
MDEVFKFVTDFSRANLWMSLVLTSQPLDAAIKQPCVGYCYTNLYKFLNHQLEITYQIIEFKPNCLLTAKTIASSLPSLLYYSFETLSSGIRLTQQQEIELLAPFQPFEPVLHKSLTRQAAQDLVTLQDWLESGLYKSL